MEISNFSVLVLVAFAALLMQVRGQLNWGKKVPCYEKSGMILCPGCNSRAGLQCPRRPNDRPEFPSCEEPLAPGFWTTKTLTTTGGPSTTTSAMTTTYTTTPEEELTTEPHIWTSTPVSPEIKLFLYSYFSRRNRWRIPREAVEEDTREICNTNADCPCPLICCKQGKGCPKRCVMGLRMHPHFG